MAYQLHIISAMNEYIRVGFFKHDYITMFLNENDVNRILRNPKVNIKDGIGIGGEIYISEENVVEALNDMGNSMVKTMFLSWLFRSRFTSRKINRTRNVREHTPIVSLPSTREFVWAPKLVEKF